MGNIHETVASADATRQQHTSEDSINTASEDASTDTPSKLNKSQDRILSSLVKNWQNHTEKDLAARHRLGSQVRDLLAKTANKNGRQPRGLRVMETVAERLGLSKGEISRARKFAENYPTFEAFRQKHPGVHTWTQVKEQVLPKRNKQKAAKAKTDRGVSVPTIASRISKVSDHLNHGLRVDRDSKDGQALYAAIQLLITEANKTLGTDFADRSTASETRAAA